MSNRKTTERERLRRIARSRYKKYTKLKDLNRWKLKDDITLEAAKRSWLKAEDRLDAAYQQIGGAQ